MFEREHVPGELKTCRVGYGFAEAHDPENLAGLAQDAESSKAV